MPPKMNRVRYVAQAGMVAAVYATLTIVTNQFLQMFSWGLLQFRISEAATVLALFTPAAVPGLGLGCLVANLVNLGQTGPLGWLDVVFGSLATLLGAAWTWRFRSRRWLALLGPVLFNALIIPAYLPILLQGAGIMTIPVLGLDLAGSWLRVYLVGMIAIALGQAVVVYGLGWGLASALERLGISEAMK